MNVQVPPRQADQGLPERENLKFLKTIRKYLIGGAALALVLGGYWYYTHSSAEEAGHRRQMVAPVKVALAERRAMPVIERTIGTVVANATVSVTARVAGQLVAAPFKEGQMVKTGDLLFQIDPRPYQAALAQAQAQMARDQAALANAEADARRYGVLYAQNAISTQQRDQSIATAKGLEAVVEADKAAVETARLDLEFTKIRSPVDGKTGPILLQPGNLVSVNGMATPLVTIAQIQPIKVSFALPQADLPRIQKRARTHGGLKALVDLHDAGGDAQFSAPIDFISNAVNPTSGTIELRATFPNEDGALVPGQLVDVVVELDELAETVVVPRDAVNTGPDGQYVYVVTPERVAQLRPVKVLFDDGVNVAVAGDVQDKDKVIVDGQLRVVPGAAVSFGKIQPHKAGPPRPAIEPPSGGGHSRPPGRKVEAVVPTGLAR